MTDLVPNPLDRPSATRRQTLGVGSALALLGRAGSAPLAGSAALAALAAIGG